MKLQSSDQFDFYFLLFVHVSETKLRTCARVSSPVLLWVGALISWTG
jgi:hypothetical protein